MKRRMMVSGSCRLGSFAALALSGAAFGDFVFFTDPGEFFAALEEQNKFSDGSWDFDPNNVGPGFIGAFSDPLNYLTVDDNPFWESMPLDDVQFQSNLNPQGEGGPNPRGVNALAFATAPFLGIENNVLVANTFVDSFDILSGVPTDDDHTAMAINVVSLASGGTPVHITVWDNNEEHAQKLIIGPLGDQDEQFVGILAVDERSIGRVNIYDTGNGAEGISAIEVFFFQVTCLGDLDNNGIVGSMDLVVLLCTWGSCEGCPADFDGDGNVGASDLMALLANWGPCPRP